MKKIKILLVWSHVIAPQTLTVLLGFALALSQAQDKANVILITVDTLRADRLECYGYRRIETPNINRLARDGVLFGKAFAQVPLTLPSHWSILTGTYPTFHRVRDNAHADFPTDAPMLAETLRSRGYRTAAFVGSFILERRFGLARGFDYYGDRFHAPLETGASAADVQRRGDEVVGEFRSWLESSRRQGLFAWIHLFDPHDPYEPPEPYRSMFKTAPYDGEVAFVDRLVGDIIAELESRKLYRDSIMVLTADHGESLGEHGESTHGFFLYDASLHVPLIFKLADRSAAGSVIPEQVRTIDIAPTILQLTGIPRPSSMQGVGLASWIRGPGAAGGLDCYSETYYPRYAFGWSDLQSLRLDRFKYIEAPRPELYDLKKDSAESRNVLESNQAVASELRRRLLGIVSKYSSRPAAAQARVPVDPRTLERLRSLGYIALSSPVAEGSARSLPDPKDRIELFRIVQDALVASNAGRGGEAIRLLERALKLDQKVPAARLVLGLEYQKKGEHERAADEFRQVLAHDEKNVLALFNLALSYAHLDRREGAILGLRRTLDLDPSYSKAHTYLGIIYQQQNRLDEAVNEYEWALKLDPRDFRAANNLAVVYAGRGLLDRALAEAQRAVEIDPGNPDGHITLGSVLFMHKAHDAAIGAYRKALAQNPRSVEAQVNLGLAFTAKGALDDAIPACRRAVALDPQRPEPHACLGQAYLKKGMTVEAEEEFRIEKRLSALKKK